MPTISVIMGVYNCKNFDLLKKSIESIINQTYKDWEFIICDDGSTNNTLDELYKISNQDPRIKILTYSPNKGLEYALNFCLSHAEGNYIARQDDDDISESCRLEKELLFLENNTEYDMVGTTAITFDDNGNWGRYILPEKPVKKSFLWTSPFLHPSIIFRKKSLMKVGGYRISKEVRRLEDYDLFMRMYSMGMKGYNIQENLYYYRIVRNMPKRYRKMKDRVNEAKVRYYGFKKMGILLIGIPFIFKPIVVGVIPVKLFNKITEKKYKTY